MKTKSSVIAIANLIIAMLVFINVDAHSTEKNNFNFNVSTSNIYSPGDQVTLSSSTGAASSRRSSRPSRRATGFIVLALTPLREKR